MIYLLSVTIFCSSISVALTYPVHLKIVVYSMLFIARFFTIVDLLLSLKTHILLSGYVEISWNCTKASLLDMIFKSTTKNKYHPFFSIFRVCLQILRRFDLCYSNKTWTTRRFFSFFTYSGLYDYFYIWLLFECVLFVS